MVRVATLLKARLIQSLELGEGHKSGSWDLAHLCALTYLKLTVDSAIYLLKEVAPATLCSLRMCFSLSRRQLYFRSVEHP